LSPGGYFFTNLLIHTLNTGLVFIAINKLLKLLKYNAGEYGALIISAAVACWFGIHPMHVESVAWLFERKDVLYTFFYLFGLVTYLNYVSTTKQKWLFITLLLFGASCISKPMAVVFPATLLLVDYLLGRNFKWTPLLEKIPFVVLSIIIGAITLHTQSKDHAFSLSFPFITKIMIASYSFLAYIGKLFLPVHLSGFYPYPFLPGQSPPFIFYVSPLIALVVVSLPLYLTSKKNKTYFKIVVFAYGFYLVNIALVLQFFSVGFAIISDRYSYISYIGLFFMLAYFLNELYIKADASKKTALQTTVLLLTLVLAYMGYQRTLVWQNTETMLTNVIEQYPAQVPQAYKYLGIYYGKQGRTQDAFNCYNTLINTMHERDADAYCNMGSVYMSVNKIDSAVKYLTESLQIDSNVFMSYRNLGIIYANKGDYQTAFAYYNKAMKIYPNDEGLYNNIGYAHMSTKQYSNAINDYNFLIHLSPDNALYYFNRGVAEYTLNNINEATEDFERTITLPVMAENQSYNLRASAAHNLSVIYKDKGDKEKSSYYDSMTQQLGGVK